METGNEARTVIHSQWYRLQLSPGMPNANTHLFLQGHAAVHRPAVPRCLGRWRLLLFAEPLSLRLHDLLQLAANVLQLAVVQEGVVVLPRPLPHVEQEPRPSAQVAGPPEPVMEAALREKAK